MERLKMIEIIYSAKNFVVLKVKKLNTYYCYSYGKMIASYCDRLFIDYSQIETQKNKCHLKQFNEIMKELEQNNTL